MPSTVRLKFEFGSHQSAETFRSALRQAQAPEGTRLAKPVDSFASADVVVDFAVKFIEGGGLEAIAATAILIDTILDKIWSSDNDDQRETVTIDVDGKKISVARDNAKETIEVVLKDATERDAGDEA